MIRVELPSGACLPSYLRLRDENIVVLTGAIEVGSRTLPSGSFIHLRANEGLALTTKSGAILQIFGDGPWSVTVSGTKAPLSARDPLPQLVADEQDAPR